MNLSLLPWFGGLLGVVVVLAFFMHMKHEADLVPDLRVKIENMQIENGKLSTALNISEKRREAEGKQATESINTLNSACDVRVAEAKRSATEIKALTHAITVYDKNHCPVRPMLNSEQLRNALGAAN